MKSVKFQSPVFQWSVLFGFHLAWGCLLRWGVFTYGLGTSRDSVEYLFTSVSLMRGDGYLSFLGQPYVLWPPLYPLLLALIQWVRGIDPLDAALALQWITFIWLAALTAWLFQHMFPRRFVLAFLSNALAGVGAALTALFQAVGSDYLFIALVLSAVYLCDTYITGRRTIVVWLMTLVCALAMLQRYIGITVLFTCIWIVFWYSPAGACERTKRFLPLGLSIIPVGIWILGLPTEAVLRNDPSSLFENIYWFTFSVLSWFFPEGNLYAHPIRTQFGMWTFWLGILLCGAVAGKFRKSQDATAAIPLFVFGTIYTIVIILIATLSSFNSLDSRFASPIFVPLVALIATSFEKILSFEFLQNNPLRAAISLIAHGALLAAVILSGSLSFTSLELHRKAGWGYTSLDWATNDVINYWLTYQPEDDYLVFSNYPAGIAIRTWHATLPSPRRTLHPNVGEAIIPLETYLPALFASGKDTFLIWIEPNQYTHVYSVDDLRRIVQVERLYESAKGGVYRLAPLR